MERIRGRQTQAAWQRYVLPVGIAFVGLLLIVSFFSRGGAGAAKTGSFVEVAPDAADATVRIVYNGAVGDATIDKAEKVYKDEKAVADKGVATVKVPGSDSDYRLKERGRLKFLGAQGGTYAFQLENSELWARERAGNATFKMSYLDVVPDAGSVVDLFQNQVASTVYVVAGSATVGGKGGTGTVTAGNKVTVLSGDAAGDPSAKQEPIDDAFRTSAWFTANGGAAAMAGGQTAGTGSMAPAMSGEAGTRPAAGVTFDYPTDELTVEAATVDVSGTAPRAAQVVVAGKSVAVDAATRKFTVAGVALAEGANDLVWKALDAEGTTLDKGVLTVYAPKKKASAAGLPNKVVSYPISDKDYKILAPAGNPYTTSEDFVKISGQVPAGVVDHITVNDFQLQKSFRKGGTSWYYFANKEFGTLGDGLNLYKIRYYAADGKLLLESLFTIVREAAPAVSSEASSATGAKQ